MADSPKRADNRGQWTIKHADVGPEFQSLVRTAAERQGMTVGSFVVETLRERAQTVLKGQDPGTPLSTPPARLEDVAGVLTASIADAAERLAREQAERMERLERQQADRLGAIERQARRGRWRR